MYYLLNVVYISIVLYDYTAGHGIATINCKAIG